MPYRGIVLDCNTPALLEQEEAIEFLPVGRVLDKAAASVVSVGCVRDPQRDFV